MVNIRMQCKQYHHNTTSNTLKGNIKIVKYKKYHKIESISLNKRLKLSM